MAKKHKHPEHVNLERWLVSYADFITLLFAFFVVLFSSSQVDRSKSKKMALAIESAFNRFSIFKYQAGDTMEEQAAMGSGGNAMKFHEYLIDKDGDKIIIVPPKIEVERESVSPPRADEALDANAGFVSNEENALAHAKRNLLNLIDQFKMKSSVRVNIDDRGIVISIRDAGIFESGADKLTIRSKDFLEGVSRIISRLPNQIRVEGHTDDQDPSKEFQSNWDLSTARATYIVKIISSEFKVNPARFSAVGYGEYRPIADNSTEEGRMKNRRVDVVILSDAVAKKEPLPAVSNSSSGTEMISKKVMPAFQESKGSATKEESTKDDLKETIQKTYDSAYDPNRETISLPNLMIKAPQPVLPQ